MDLSNKTDRELLEEIHAATAGRALVAGDGKGPDDLMGDKGDASDKFVPVPGIEKILGPRPHPSEATDGTVWRREAAKITKIYLKADGSPDAPEEYEAGAMKLAAATGVVAVFVDYQGETKACLRPGLSPWLIPAESISSDDNADVEGVIRAVLDAK